MNKQRVAELAALIGKIASQTHIAVLNAELEAARDGASETGLEPLASDLRLLARRAAAAAREIRELSGVPPAEEGNQAPPVSGRRLRLATFTRSR